MQVRRRFGRLSTWAIAWVIGGALGASACNGKLPAPASAASCGDRCATMSCPAGSTCSLDARCVPRCDPEQIRPHY
jgi:hypothetical protein